MSMASAWLLHMLPEHWPGVQGHRGAGNSQAEVTARGSGSHTPKSLAPLRSTAPRRCEALKGSAPLGTFWKALSGQLASQRCTPPLVAPRLALQHAASRKGRACWRQLLTALAGACIQELRGVHHAGPA